MSDIGIPVFFFKKSCLLFLINKISQTKKGISNYKFIQRNTVGFWLLISISLSLSKYYYNNLYLDFLFVFMSDIGIPVFSKKSCFFVKTKNYNVKKKYIIFGLTLQVFT